MKEQRIVLIENFMKIGLELSPEELETSEKEDVQIFLNAFNKAKKTGNKQIVETWVSPCKDSEIVECVIDHYKKYILPDGSMEITKTHTQ
jgi:hypothetical protein